MLDGPLVAHTNITLVATLLAIVLPISTALSEIVIAKEYR
jgi:hypothetical protein